MTQADAAGTVAADTHGGWTIVGHGAARRYLERSFDADRLAHAYLITGPEQVGRKTLALDLARLVNCVAGPDLLGDTPDRPCGRCVPCGRIARGIHSDVTVIDAHTPIRGLAPGATESTPEQDGRRTVISIHHVREMQRDIALNAFEGGRRVVIIDGAERMAADGSGANALLKTLEEPPGGVVIALIATTAAALPPTVVSRCQLIELHPVPAAEIEAGLLRREGVDPEQAALLARLAAGRPGRAIAALEDETSLDRYRQSALRILGMCAGDIEERFRYARELGGQYARDRSAIERELELWISLWRDILLLGHGLPETVVNLEWRDRLAAAAQAVTPEAARSAIVALESAAAALRQNGQPRLVLEVLMLSLPQIPADAAPGSAPGPDEA